MKDIEEILNVLEEIKNMARDAMANKMHSLGNNKIVSTKPEHKDFPDGSMEHEAMESPEFEAGEHEGMEEYRNGLENENQDDEDQDMPLKGKQNKILMIETSKKPLKGPLRMFK